MPIKHSLPEQIRFLVTTRPDPRVLKYYHRIKPFDLLEDAPNEVDDIVRYASSLLTELENKTRIQLATRISQAAEGNFLYAHLVLGDLLAQQARALGKEMHITRPLNLAEASH